MDVSELRRRIVRALDDARKDASARRVERDEAARAYDEFLQQIAVPLLKQAAVVLKSEGQLFAVQTPADTARLVSERSAETFVEIALDVAAERPQVVGRVSVARGRRGRIDERPIATGKPIRDLTEEDVTAFLVSELPRLVLKS